jgi:hypothetical protein
VSWYSDLRAFIEAAIPPADQALEEVRDRLAHDAGLRTHLFSLVAAAATDLDLVNPWESGPLSATLYLPTDTTEPTIDWLDVDEVEVDDAHELESGDIVLDMMSQGEASIDCFIPKYSPWEDDADIYIHDADWNEWVVWATARRQMRLLFTVSYDRTSGELSDVDITHWEGVERVADG